MSAGKNRENEKALPGDGQRLYHAFGPLFDERSEILILGSFPSVKSREQMFYYGHPQNRFWKVVAALCEEMESCVPFCAEDKTPVPHRTEGKIRVPQTVEEKKALLIAHRIALWDVIASCEITGSSDSSIRNAEVNDLSVILGAAPVRRIGVNGSTAFRLFEKYMSPQLKAYGLTMNDVVKLPSTSPANAAWSAERLTESWSTLLQGLTSDSPPEAR